MEVSKDLHAYCPVVHQMILTILAVSHMEVDLK